jgi:hypothetical protein
MVPAPALNTAVLELPAGTIPYRPNKNVVIDLGTKTKLAIIGDWGTGDEVAINVLQQVATLKPDVLMHVGDVYYAGTQNEAHTNFLDICRIILGNSVPLFSLASVLSSRANTTAAG